ncbi:MAG: recombination mediator RecR [Lentisphaeria bacterium]|nr:recombination mediator RecR [Lentisphaeria bacterium]
MILTDALSRLPGIGKRTAERLALSLLAWERDALADLGRRLASLKDDVTVCPECGNLAAGGRCAVCADPRREKDVICVVETALQIPPIEASGSFRGCYHVLGGKIQPLEGKGPDDIRLAELRERLSTGDVSELILATGSDVEGESTAVYISQECGDIPGLRISRIASGIPVGADLSYADSATIAMAIGARKPAR